MTPSLSCSKPTFESEHKAEIEVWRRVWSVPGGPALLLSPFSWAAEGGLSIAGGGQTGSSWGYCLPAPSLGKFDPAISPALPISLGHSTMAQWQQEQAFEDFLSQPRGSGLTYQASLQRPGSVKMSHTYPKGFPGGSDGKESASNAGDLGLIPGLERSPGEGNGYPLQYSCLEIPWTEEPGRLRIWIL